MHDVEGMFATLYLVENGLEFLFVEQIAIVERHFLPSYLLDSFERRGLTVGLCHAVREVIYGHYVVTALQELDDTMTADVTGASGYENGPPIFAHFSRQEKPMISSCRIFFFFFLEIPLSVNVAD